MPAGFQIFYVNRFPSFESESISTSTQLLLVDPRGTGNKEEIHSRITRTDKTVLHYQKYIIYYEHPRNLRYRLYEEVHNQLIQINEFNSYYSPEKNRLVIEAPKDLAAGAVRVFEKEKLIEAQQKDVDFPSVLEKANNVYGNWFGNLPPGRVKTIAIFGDHVDLSSQYTELIQAGAELKFVIIELEIDGRIYKVGISKNRGITFYERLDLVDQLQFIDNVHSWFP